MKDKISRRAAIWGVAGVGALPYIEPTTADARKLAKSTGVPQEIDGRQFRQDETGTPRSILEKLREHPSVLDRGAKGDGVAMDGAAIQDALRANDHVWVPPGIYMIDVPLEIPSYMTLEFSSRAIFKPAHDSMTIFKTGEACYAGRIIGARIHGAGKSGITAFNMVNFRHRAEIARAEIRDCEDGIILRQLCWDTILYMPLFQSTARPITVSDGSNALDIIHPGMDTFETGITIETGPTYTTATVRISGGYIQNGIRGIKDNGAFGTLINGTYFEGNKEADIDLAKTTRTSVSHTQHYTETGKTAIRARDTEGLTVFDPLMTSGARTLGLYDIDRSNRNATRFETITTFGVNTPLGDVSGCDSLTRESRGVFVPSIEGVALAGSAKYERQLGSWQRIGSRIFITADIAWKSHTGSGGIKVLGIPAHLLPLANGPAIPLQLIVSNPGAAAAPAFGRLDMNGHLSIFTAASGAWLPFAGAKGGEFVLACDYAL